MNLPKFALAHKPVVFGFAIVLFAWGVNVFLDAPRREDPEFTIREALVITDWPGATAQQVEELVTDKVEKAAANMKQVRRVQSWSSVGRSVVQVTGTDDITDVQKTWTKLRAEVELLLPTLPEGALPPVVDDNFGETAALVLALYQDPEAAKQRQYTPRELEVFAKRLRDHLMDLRPAEEASDGRFVPVTTDPAYVVRLDLDGVQEEVIYLEADAGEWSKLDLTSDELQELLAERNVIAPAGVFNTATSRITTRLSGNFDAAREIDRVVVGRVAAGSESPERQTLTELERELQAGGGANTAQPTAYEVPVHLNDVEIRVRRAYMDPATSRVRYGDAEMSHDAIVVSFSMKPGQNITWLGDAVDRLLAESNHTFLAPDIRVQKVSNPPLIVQNKIDAVVSNLLQAIGLVLLILGLMAGLRVAIVTAVSIPLIMLSAVALMRLWDIEIEQISLAALIVALGLLVDNAIVTSENTTRFLNEGMAKEDAVILGCNQVGTSLLWSSLTTIGVFIPMAFALPGGLGEYIFSLPVVVTLTLLVSWLCAMTMTPILNYYVLAPSDGRLPIVKLCTWIFRRASKASATGTANVASSTPSQKSGGFASLCGWVIKLRFATIGVAFALLAGSLMLPVPSSFFPKSDHSQFVVDVWLPEAAPIYKTDEVTGQVERIIRHLNDKTWDGTRWVSIVDDDGQPAPRLDNMAVYVGIGGPRFYTSLNPQSDAPYYANILVNTVKREDVSQYVADVRRAAWHGIGQPGDAEYLAPIAGARVVPHMLVMGTPVSAPIQYRVTGPRLANEKVLRKHGEMLKNVLRDSGLVWDVHDSWGAHGLQLDVNLRTDEASMAGVTNENVAHSLNTYYSGLYLTRFREGDHQIPVMLRLPPEQRQSLESVRSAYVEGFTGKVPLDSVADFEMDRVPSLITRYQRERSLWVMGRPEPGLLARAILSQLAAQVKEIEAQLPPGYRIENGGIEEEAERGERANSVALGIGIVLVVFCLLLQYNSAIKPMLVLLTVPLAVIGGMLGLYLRDIPMGFMEALGFLALFGTVLNAAILLIDFSEQLIKEKVAKGEGVAAPGERAYCGLTKEAFRSALGEAAEARMMPIFMTTMTTVAGLMSLMFGGGPLFMGLATVFAVGLLLGSGITLLV
ncbi:MAG: efflux RND transporter permease subunit, partial [Gammaproteobacteria bacterium]